MTVIDDFTAGCTSQLPLEDKALYTLALVDQAFVLLYGADQAAWFPKQKAAYETAMDEVHDAYDAAKAVS